MEITIEIADSMVESIVGEELERICLKHWEADDTVPRGMLYRCAERLRLPKGLDSWQMLSAAGNRAMHAAGKRVIRRILKHISESQLK